MIGNMLAAVRLTNWIKFYHLGTKAASLEHWIDRGPRTPFVIVSTHFLSIKSVLPRDNPILAYKTFTYEIHDDDLVHFYQVL